ncbi:MAG TPA: hypothetical protein PKA98_09070 [Acidimicrobiales bacterium]|nr:hypothetical protein [Acidimicrobiales bacterium]
MTRPDERRVLGAAADAPAVGPPGPGPAASGVHRWPRPGAVAPPERLAAVRILTGGFAVAYLAVRAPVILAVRDRAPGTFSPVGVLRWLDQPLPDAAVVALLAAAIGAGVAFTVGAGFRVSGPLFAVAVLLLGTYRSSWGQLLHFENLLVLHLLVLGVAASADAWSLDSRRRDGPPRAGHDHGAPLRLLCLVVVVSYAIAGVAKLRYGGLAWASGDTLANHIAYTATRLELFGEAPAPLAGLAVRHAWALTPLAVASLLIELGAPIALLGGWWRNTWVAGAWLMHLAIAATMAIVFPFPLFLVAFAPFYEVERVVPWLQARQRRPAAPDLRSATRATP